jgi:hypothetical protein
VLVVSGCGHVVLGPSDGASDGSSDTPLDVSVDDAATIARVQTLTPPFVDAAKISAQMTLTAGHVVIVVPYWNDSSHTITVSDTTAQTWMPAARGSVPTGCSRNLGTNVQMFYAPVRSSGATTVSATQSGGAGLMGMFIVEYSGLVATDPFDTTAGKAAQTASNLITTGRVTTTSFDLLVAGFHDSDGGGEMIPGPGFTALARDTSSYSMISEMTGPAGLYEATANLPASMSDACWVAAVIALRAR